MLGAIYAALWERRHAGRTEAVMSISEREQQILDSIGNELRESAPSLMSWMATFTRLTDGERMPAREKIPGVPSGRGHAAPVGAGMRASCAGRPATGARSRTVRLIRVFGSRPARRLLWLSVALAMLTLALLTSPGPGPVACTAPLTSACPLRMPPPPPAPSRLRPGATSAR